MHSMQHMQKIEEIIDSCGFPGQRFVNQSQFISAMLLSSEEPLVGCIGQQYSPPPDHNVPMLILATNVRIVALISNADVDQDFPSPSLSLPYDRMDKIHVYESNRSDGEFRIQYKGNRRIIVFDNVASSLSSMMDDVYQLNYDLKIYKTTTPLDQVYSKWERMRHKFLRVQRTLGRFVSSNTLTMVLNMLLAAAVIAHSIVLLTQ